MRALPHQTAAIVTHVRVGIEQGLFEVLQVGLSTGKLAHQRPVGDASLPLEHRDRRIENLL